MILYAWSIEMDQDVTIGSGCPSLKSPHQLNSKKFKTLPKPPPKCRQNNWWTFQNLLLDY